jgi:hypothetical protein
MADLYVRSADGSDSDNGSTWALAKATLAGAGAPAAHGSGDRIFLSDAHSESTGSAIAIVLDGTAASPVQIICGDDAAEPPTTVATTAVVATSGTFSMSFSGVYYCRGVRFNVATGSSSSASFATAQASDSSAFFESCVIDVQTTSSSGRVYAGGTIVADRTRTHFKNVDLKFANTSQRLNVAGDVVWDGGSVLSGSSLLTSLVVVTTGTGTRFTASGIDLSNLGSSLDLIDGTATTRACLIRFRNCKLPSGWAGDLFTGTVGGGVRGEMYNCDDGDTNYGLWIEDSRGSIRDETTIKRTGGASDGTTGISYKMESGSNVSYPFGLESQEITRWQETVGSPITVSVEIVHDAQGDGSGGDFQTDEISLQVQYLGTSGFPLGSFVSSGAANVLTTPTDYTNSSETWTTTGIASPVKQTLSVTFTPEEKGTIIAKVVLHKGPRDVYFCPKLTVT